MGAVAHSSLVLCSEVEASFFVVTCSEGFFNGEGWATTLPEAQRFPDRAAAYRFVVRRGRWPFEGGSRIQVRGVRQL